MAQPQPRTFVELYSDAAVDDRNGQYASVMATFDPLATILAADLFAAVSDVDPVIPNAYIGMFDAPGVPGGLSMVIHGICRFPTCLGQVSPWTGKTFGFIQDVDSNGDIATVEIIEDYFALAGAGLVTVPNALETVDELWAADEAATMLPAMVNHPVDTRDIRTRHLMFVPAKYLPIVINRRMTPRELWTDLACTIADDANLLPCRNLVNWILCAGVRPAAGAESALRLDTPAVPLADAALFQHRRRQLYLQLPALRAPTGPPDTNAQMFNIMGQVVEEQRLAREGAEAHRARGRTARTPSAFWADNIQQILLLCGVDDEADLPPMWHALAASASSDRNVLDGHFRRLAVANNAAFQGPVITPELTKRLTALAFAGNDRDDLAQGIQPFNLIVTDPGDPEGNRLATEAEVSGSEYDQLMLGGTSQALADLRELRTVARISLNLTFRQAKRKLQALRILLLGMLGAGHPLYLAYHAFVGRYLQDEEQWQARMRHPLAPAVLLRYVQLKLNVWFRQQETREVNPPVPSPHFAFLFEQLNDDCSAWVPGLPLAYLAPPVVPVPAPLGPSARPPRAHPVAAPNAPDSKPVRLRGDAVVNPAPSPLFTPHQAAIKTTTITAMMAAAKRPPPTIARNGHTVPMCATFHLKGKCFANCERAADHFPHTDAENGPLVAWTIAGLT
jgi:hypothetical protein